LGAWRPSEAVIVKPVCLITGAGGRLGAALCAELVETSEVIAVYRSRLPPVSSQLRMRTPNILAYDPRAPAPRSVYCIQADLSAADDLRRVTEVALARFGRIDAIVNAAADTKFHGRLVDLWGDSEAVRRQLLINCVAPFELVSAIHHASWKNEPEENARWNRNVVNVSSVSGLIVARSNGQAFYGASKAALNMLTMYLSLELAPYSVRVNAVCPAEFTEPAATAGVVSAIRTLLEGDATGDVLTRI
jgi:NAD(P)-dependent dehydrogenase (short-subunit alcohol dehydrogenase family)